MTDLEIGLNFGVSLPGGSPVGDVGKTSDRNGVKITSKSFFWMAFKCGYRITPQWVGETGDDQTVSKEDQMMLEFKLPTQVLKNNIKNFAQWTVNLNNDF